MTVFCIGRGISSSKKTFVDFLFSSPWHVAHLTTGCASVFVTDVGIGLRYENASLIFFSFFVVMRLRNGFLPNNLFLICSNWYERVSILCSLSLSLSSSSLIFCLSSLFSSSSTSILFRAIGYRRSRFVRRINLCFISSVESGLTSFSLTHRYWQEVVWWWGVWILTNDAVDVHRASGILPTRECPFGAFFIKCDIHIP